MGASGRQRFALKIGLAVAMFFLSVLILSGCADVAAIPRGWSGATIADSTLFVGSMEGKLVAVNTAEGGRLWEVTLQAPASSGSALGCAPTTTRVALYGSPAVSENLVYLGGYIPTRGRGRGMVYAFASGRDEPKWVYPRQGTLDGAVVGAVTLAQGKVFFAAADGKVYALDAGDGYREWEFATGDKIWSTPAVSADTLFVGSFDKKLYALKTADGSKKWDFETGGAIAATPVLADNTVYIASFDRYLYALDALNGSLKWKFLTENWLWAKPVVYNGAVYAAGLDGKVYVLRTGSGDKLAEFDLGSPISSSPVVVGDSVIVATEAGVVYALESGGGQKELASLQEKISAPLAASGERVYIHTARDGLYELDAQSGKLSKFSLGSK